MVSRDARLGVLAFAVAVAFWPGTVEASLMPRWAAIAVGLPLVSSMDLRVLPRWLLCAMACGVVYAGIVTLGSPHPWGGEFDVFCIALLCMATVVAAETDSSVPLSALGWGIGVSSAFALAQFFRIDTGVPHNNAAGLFLNSEILAEISAPLFLWAFWKKQIPLALVLAVPLAICGSRIAIFVALFGILHGWKAPRRGIKPLIVVLIAGAGVGAVLGTSAISSGQRVMFWLTGIMSITPFGHGMGWWHAAHPFPYEEFVHSDLIQAFVELGVGALFFAAIPVGLLWSKGGPRAERIAFTAVCIEGCVSFPLHMPATGFLAALLAGRMVAYGNRVRGEHGARPTEGRGYPGPATTDGRTMDADGRRDGVRVPLRPAFARFAKIHSSGHSTGGSAASTAGGAVGV